MAEAHARDPSRSPSIRRAVGGHSLPKLWGRRGFWQIGLRWAVPPVMLAGVAIAWVLGFEFRVVPILLIAAASPIYNLFFAWIFDRYEEQLRSNPRLDRGFTLLEVIADYAAMFLLLHFTGGVSSPLIVFLLFHVVIAAIQFSAAMAYQLAALAAAGLWLMLVGQLTGWLPSEGVTFRGQPVQALDRPAYAAVLLIVFTVTLFVTAGMISRIMRRFRARVSELAAVTAELSAANQKLGSLYAMVCAIGAERGLQPVLQRVVDELARVMEVPAVAVKLLSDDGRTLRYVAARGLPDEIVAETVIDLDRSPLNRRIIDGETLVHGRVGKGSQLQLQDELITLGIRSAVLTPLKIEQTVIGTLGLYSNSPGRFRQEETDFLELAAGLVAIAIEDARANEAVETLMEERTQFMLQVAHNLRAPLGAGLSLLDLVREGHMGEVTPKQAEALERVEHRLRALHTTIGELLIIAKARDWSREIPDVVVNLEELARHTETTFREHAERKKVRLSVSLEGALPDVDSGVDLLEQVMENLVSNAIKYTPEGGEVEVRFMQTRPDEIRIMVRDTGIGIPASEQGKLFKEFFRASNAKRVTAAGTGLGLALVKQTVERHRGRVMLTSDAGQGTTFVIDLPVRRPESNARPAEQADRLA